MDNYVTEATLNKALARTSGSLYKALEKQTQEITQVIRDLSDIFSAQIQDVKVEISELRKSHSELINTVDSLAQRFDDHEIENSARDAELDRHDRRIKKIAKKTDVELKT